MTKKRWVYTEGGRPLPQPVEVTQDWSNPGSGASLKSEAEVYGNLTPATDGTDISTRTRHQQYMKRNNLTVAEDFTQHWEKAAKEREKVFNGQVDRAERRETIGRALHEARRKRNG